MLEHIDTLNNVLEYMKHTVYGKNENKNVERIEVLKILIQYIAKDKIQCLSETMIYAAWFGETEIVKFLIENGADKAYQNVKGLRIEECAERAEKIFNDNSLMRFLIEK